MSRKTAKQKQSENYTDAVTEAVGRRYAIATTDHVESCMKGGVQTDPVAKQYVPQLDELKILPQEDTDPIGDGAHTPVKGIVHRYPDRVLFKPANVCAVYCRYCFRREHVGPGSDVLKPDEREAALNYIKNNPEIWEVILTGGDPLILSPRQLGEIIAHLGAIEHVRVIRLHTRIPIADPQRVNEKMLTALNQTQKPVYMALHVNHAQEISDDVRTALKELHKAGIHMLSQSVLLKGVNNNAETLSTLYRELISLHVKPYYLHHPDLAPGTSHFRISIEEGQNIMRELLGKLSGLCQPTYMLDIPGGHGKIPLTPCYIEPENTGYKLKDFKGHTHSYKDDVE